jgi:Zn-dependent protease with chaperone function
MAPVGGYVSHALRNRRRLWWLVACYVLVFELIGALAITMMLLLFDEEHTILSNPLGYAVRYALPVAALAGLQFWFLYHRHAKAVVRSLAIHLPTRAEEPRLWRIAEEQCTTLGVRQPQFGIIEEPALNALTVGEGPVHGLIAVTRGLLDSLDDDELAAVLAHEASHIRNGDTKLHAANHALMRTAVILQVHNPFRLEDWRQMLVIVLIPPALLLLVVGGAVTMACMRLARAARRGLRLSRDHIADGEAIRVTHFPEALVSALRKVGGRGVFLRGERFDDLMFEGRSGHEGGSHPAVEERVEAILALGHDLLQYGRLRRDTRERAQPHAPLFGRRAPISAGRANARLLKPEQPETPSSRMLLLFFTDREKFWKWQNACIVWTEWRESDDRNAFGIQPKMLLPLALTTVAVVVLHWPSNGDYVRMWNRFSPSAFVDLARVSHRGPFCSGPSYPDNKCTDLTPGIRASAVQRLPKAHAVTTRTKSEVEAEIRATRLNGWLGAGLFVLLAIAFLKPGLLRFLFGVTDARETRENVDDLRPIASIVLSQSRPSQNSTKRHDVAIDARPPRFGRRGT